MQFTRKPYALLFELFYPPKADNWLQSFTEESQQRGLDHRIFPKYHKQRAHNHPSTKHSSKRKAITAHSPPAQTPVYPSTRLRPTPTRHRSGGQRDQPVWVATARFLQARQQQATACLPIPTPPHLTWTFEQRWTTSEIGGTCHLVQLLNVSTNIFPLT